MVRNFCGVTFCSWANRPPTPCTRHARCRWGWRRGNSLIFKSSEKGQDSRDISGCAKELEGRVQSQEQRAAPWLKTVVHAEVGWWSGGHGWSIKGMMLMGSTLSKGQKLWQEVWTFFKRRMVGQTWTFSQIPSKLKGKFWKQDTWRSSYMTMNT